MSRDEAKAKEAMAAVMAFDAEGREKRDALGIKSRFTPQAIFPQGAPDNPAAIVDALTARLLVRPLRSTTREALIAAGAAAQPADRVKEVARLILASPEYQMA